MLTFFGQKDKDGRFVSHCGKYFIQNVGDAKSKGWLAAKFDGKGGFTLLARDVDHEDARYACEDDKYREPCGCVLIVRPDWWKHCPKCGAVLAPRPPPEPLPPKKERKKKPPVRPEWLKKATSGYEHGQDWDCVYEGKNWALVRIPGYTGWVSLGTSAYHQTHYEVMRTSGSNHGCHISDTETKGLTSLLKVKRFMKEPEDYVAFNVHEGRATKEDLARFRAMVDELDAKGL